MKIVLRCAGLMIIGSMLCGCATCPEPIKVMMGTSTKLIEGERGKGIVKTFNYSIAETYMHIQKGIKNIPKFEVYARSKTKGMIAVYYLEVNTSIVGIFIDKVDDTHTKVEVASPSPSARARVAHKLFDLMEWKPTKAK